LSIVTIVFIIVSKVGLELSYFVAPALCLEGLRQ